MVDLSPFEAWVKARLVPSNEAAMAASEGRVREMDTDALKALWDGSWPLGDVVQGIYLEHVHAELNRRGEGRHCAV